MFATHWGHLAIIFLWLSGTLFHIRWTGNFSYWKLNPISTIAVSHLIWDPHFSASYTRGDVSFNSTPSYSGIYHWLYAVGFTSEAQIYYFVLGCELFALSFLLLGKFHLLKTSSLVNWIMNKRPTYNSLFRSNTSSLPIRFTTAYTDSTGLRLNFHIASLFGTFSCLWTGHLVHISIPASRGNTSFKLLADILNNQSTGLLPALSLGDWHQFMVHNDF